MLDSLSIKIIKWPLAQSAKLIDKCGVTANQTTLFGFALGCFALPALMAEQYTLALAFILLNRICDGLDGALARIQGITDAGGFLDELDGGMGLRLDQAGRNIGVPLAVPVVRPGIVGFDQFFI